MNTSPGNNVWNTEALAKELSQNNVLKIMVNASDSPYAMPPEQYEKFLVPHRGPAYFFMFFEKGITEHQVDLKPIIVSEGQLLFTLPNQVHVSPPLKEGVKFFTMGFAQSSSSLLSQQFSFLINPFNTPTISFDETSRQRVVNLFEILNKLLHADNNEKDTLIIISYLNSLLTEFNIAYFRNGNTRPSEDHDLRTFIQFKLEIEKTFRDQPSVGSIASSLSISDDKLNKIVKHYSGQSPKEYQIQRLILEAQRILFYGNTSTKELAYELGFSDPDYFSRLFKKRTGKNVSEFTACLKELSR